MPKSMQCPKNATLRNKSKKKIVKQKKQKISKKQRLEIMLKSFTGMTTTFGKYNIKVRLSKIIGTG